MTRDRWDLDQLQDRLRDQLGATVRVERRPDGELMLDAPLRYGRALTQVYDLTLHGEPVRNMHKLRT